MKRKRTNQGFTLVELLVVITIIALLTGMALPAIKRAILSAKMITDVSKVRQIIAACENYASDWDGQYPSYDPDNPARGEAARFTTSTEAFNVLLPQYVDMEAAFWIQTNNPDKDRSPNEDGILTQDENTYAYVSGLKSSSYSGSPLVADGEMDEPGVYGESHPWLPAKKAIVGYVGGHVVRERLTSTEPGATVRSKDGLVQNIFLKRQKGDSGGKSGGFLDTDPSNILLP